MGEGGMKTAIYIEDGVVQLVLTPESDFEKSALRSFDKGGIEAKIFTGTFYDCRGGWVRQTTYRWPSEPYANDLNDRSLILRVSTNVPVPE